MKSLYINMNEKLHKVKLECLSKCGNDRINNELARKHAYPMHLSRA